MTHYFYDKFKSNDLTNFDINKKKNKTVLHKSLFKTNESNDVNLVKSIIKNKFNIPLKLTIAYITKQKFLILGGHKNEG